jgi:UTP--glucose-1-phosphate uridylyltransferase
LLVSEITKAVIPAAGLGTRFLPITKSMPKEMLPIIDRPVIHYVVEEAIQSGIDDILIISGRKKRAIEDYFDHSPELESHLKSRNDDDKLKLIEDEYSHCSIHYIRQKEARGLGDAVLTAKKHIGDEPFAVLLGDDILKDTTPCTKQLIKSFKKTHSSVIAVQTIPEDKISNYGIISGKKIDESLHLLEDIVEKPAVKNAPSNLGAIGRYLFTPEIFDCLQEIDPGVSNEIQLTDGIKCLLKKQHVYSYNFLGTRFDTGDKLGYIQTIVDFGLRDELMGSKLREYLESVLEK